MKTLEDLLGWILMAAVNTDRWNCRGLAKSLAEGADSSVLGWIESNIGNQPSLPFRISPTERSQHVYILGATGCGKTNLILKLLEADFSHRRSVVIVDLRGDLYDRALVRLACDSVAPELVTLIDLRKDRQSLGLNPLIGSNDPHARALQVLDVLRSQADSWGIQLDETLRNCLIALAQAQKSLLDVEWLLTDEDFRDRILEQNTDPSVDAFFDRYAELSKDRQQSWYLPVLNKVSPLLSTPRVRSLLGHKKALNLRATLDSDGSILLIALAADRLHSAAKLLGSLIIDAIEAAIMTRVDTAESRRNPVSLYIDEFETMASRSFQSLVAEGRRFRLSLTLSHQNLSQLPADLRQVIRNNARTQILFQTGSIDGRELKAELSQFPADDLVAFLQSLRVGRAVVLKRPSEPVLVQFERSLEPNVTPLSLSRYVETVESTMVERSSGRGESDRQRDRPSSEPANWLNGPTTANSRVSHRRKPLKRKD